jgi:uncharacterized phage protein (TIGR02220 family)
MELISFIKSLKKRDKIYYDIWLPILFELEEKNTVILNRRLDLSKTQYYRIISYGIKLWNELVHSTSIEWSYGKLSISKNIAVKKEIKAKKETLYKEVVQNEFSIDMNEVYGSIISYLNNKAGTSYKSETASYRKFIDSKLKSGYGLEDFYKVIDNKSLEWVGTDFQKFLRPETIFGNKFDTYLNQIITTKTAQDKSYEQVSKATELGWNKASKL